MFEAAAEPIETPDDQRVTLTKRRGSVTPTRTLPSSAANVILGHEFATRCDEGIALQLEVLLMRADASVADDYDPPQKVDGIGLMVHRFSDG